MLENFRMTLNRTINLRRMSCVQLIFRSLGQTGESPSSLVTPGPLEASEGERLARYDHSPSFLRRLMPSKF